MPEKRPVAIEQNSGDNSSSFFPVRSVNLAEPAVLDMLAPWECLDAVAGVPRARIYARPGRYSADPALGVAGKLKKAAFDEGLVCYPMAGTRDGRQGDHVLLAPPFIASEAELDGALDALGRAVERVLASV